ncbi:MAG: CoA ester lyase [Rhodospirillales bacterium]
MADTPAPRPRRSALYMPGSNARALEKGKALAADVLIFDLEDGVAPEMKDAARARIRDAIRGGGYGRRELVVRINGIDSPWFETDIRALAGCGADALLIPKTDGPDTVRRASALMADTGAPHGMGIWCMIETPMGVLNARDIAAAGPRMRALLLGSADLGKELRALPTRDRLPLLTSIGLMILAARAYGLAVLDAPHFDISDDEGFAESCRQGRAYGFDGKTLIHPRTIEAANAIYGPSEEELAWARRIIAAYRAAAAEGKGVTVVDGKLIEGLHVVEAERLIALADAVAG